MSVIVLSGSLYFYPRSPCGERPLLTLLMGAILIIFLSTLSLRRATRYFTYYFRRFLNFYPRSPCGERLGNVVAGLHMSRFLSTLSLRRATWPGLLARPFFIISIHALLAESDSRKIYHLLPTRNFYPRSPCGERPRTQSQSLFA